MTQQMRTLVQLHPPEQGCLFMFISCIALCVNALGRSRDRLYLHKLTNVARGKLLQLYPGNTATLTYKSVNRLIAKTCNPGMVLGGGHLRVVLMQPHHHLVQTKVGQQPKVG